MLQWTQTEEGLAVELPGDPMSEYAVALKITGLKISQPVD